MAKSIKPVVMVQIKSTDQITVELSTFMKTVGLNWLKDKDINFYNLAVASMIVVEKYSSTVGSLSSGDKLKCATTLVPVFLDYLVAESKVSREKADSIVKLMEDNHLLLEGFMNIAIEISHSPAMIQMVETVKEKSQQCWNKCSNKCCGVKK